MSFSNDVTMDVFLERFCHEKTRLTIRMVGGDYLNGAITGFNDNLILLDNEDRLSVVIARNMVVCIMTAKK